MTRSVLALIALSSLALAACGGGGGGGTAEIDCQSFCAKMVVCNPNETQAECEATCGQLSGAFRPEVGDRAEACAALDCADVDACMSAALTGCGGNYTPVLEAMCQKQSTCGAATDVATCVSEMLGDGSAAAMGCLTDATMSAIGGCAVSAACETFETDFPACFQERTGISF